MTEDNRVGDTYRRTFLKAGGAATVTPLAGCALLEGENDDDTVRIGHIAALEADPGVDSERGVEMAKEEINDDGGIMDQEVEVIHGDTQYDTSQTVTVVNEMIEEHDVDMVLGVQVTEIALSVIDRLAEADVPFIVTAAGGPEITRNFAGTDYEKYKNTFRVGPSTLHMAELIPEYAEAISDEHGWHQFTHVTEDAAWTQPFTDTFPDEFDARGLELVMNERIARDTSDFTPILDEVEETGASVMLKEIAHIQGAGLLAAWRESEYPFLTDGVNLSSYSPAYFDDTNSGSLYETNLQPAGGGVTPITEKTIPFTERYQSRYDNRPTMPMWLGFTGYDMMHTYRAAVERAGTMDDLEGLVDEMLATDYEGVIGRIQFKGPDSADPNEIRYGADYVTMPAVQWQEEGGEGVRECVWPDQFATATQVLPPWLE
jgi:branched-chain amino acid transport system substrate-binding protein